MNMDTKAIVEVLKSAGRALWFAFLAILVTALTALASDGAITNAVLFVGGMPINVGFVLVAAIGLLIKAIDRYRHVSRTTESNGIAPTFLQR